MKDNLTQCLKCRQHGRWSTAASLGQHLRQCPGPLLWDQFDVGRENNKRLRSELSTTPATGNQMLRDINSEAHMAHDSGTVRTANHLAAMPSLEALAAPWKKDDDLFNFFDNNGGWDDDDAASRPATQNMEEVVNSAGQDNVNAIASDTGVLINVEKHTINGEEVHVETSRFLKNANLPRSIVYELHLMHILNSHRHVDLNLFSEINDCVTYHAREHHVDFKSDKMYSRDELVRISTEVYGLHGLKPTLNRVKLSDGGEAVVPTFDVKTMLLSLLNDNSKMIVENIAPNYNLFTGKPIDPSNTNIGEIHTGWAWEEARAHHCGDQENVLPLGLICFFDKTNADLFGSIAASPFIGVPSFFNIDCRCNTDFWLPFGYVPNLAYGKGKASQQTSRAKLQDLHNCIRLVTKQIAEMRDKGYFWTVVMGRVVKVVVWIHIITGDTSGHNELCQKYNCSNTICPYRDCMCGKDDLSDSIAQCKLLTLEDVANAINEGRLHELSMHDINSAFDNVPISDIIRGIFGIVPAETLHVLGTGIIKYMLKAIVQLVGPNESKKKEKNLFDILHENLVRDAARQSERDFPRMTIPRGGFGDGTKMTGGDAFGHLLIQLCVSYTDSGLDLLRDGMTSHRISLRDYRHCIKLLLGFDRWSGQTNPIDEVENAIGLLGELIDLIKRCFPRCEGQEWDLPKIHSLSKMIHYMLKFGSTKGVSGQTGERALKEIVKDHAQQTQRRPNVFTQQVALRSYENRVLQYAFRDVLPTLGLDYDLGYNTHPAIWEGEGKFTMTFCACDRYERGPVKIVWHDRNKNDLKIGVSRVFKYAIRKFACGNGWTGQFEVEGYTRFYMRSTNCDERIQYHATEYLMGASWYDFAMIQFVEEDMDLAASVCPAKIYGFFRYTSPGVPTPHLIDDEGMSAEKIQDSFLSDSNVYAVVHAAAAYLPWSTVDHEFVSEFKLGDAQTCLYIVKAETILDPIFVFANYGGRGATKDRYHCVLPRRRWAQYFSSRIDAAAVDA